jgi:tRNA (guanine37-N1)-methyltransferase
VRFDLVTIFPDFFRGPLDHGILRRAQDAGLVEVRVHDLRAFTHDRHRTVDDRPFGGGEGMVLKPEPLFAAVEHLLGRAVGADPSDTGLFSSGGHGFSRAEMTAAEGGSTSLPQADAEPAAVGRAQRHSAPEPGNAAIVLLSASGKLFRQADARRFAQLDRIILLCGRYEGVDERVAEHLATDELSIGDFVLSGGELPAALIVDAVTRLLPGALGNEASAANESFSSSSGEMAEGGIGFSREDSHPMQSMALLTQVGLSRGILDFPHYTRPADFRGWRVPDVLISGNHADVRRWRRKMALIKTVRNRFELIAGAQLSDEDRALLAELQSESESTDANG